jgi:hypothetical protein
MREDVMPRDQQCVDGRRGEPTPKRRQAERPEWKPDPQGTWLVIRYEPQDLGARPVPNGDIYWESPDIRVVGGDALGNPIGGQPVTVEALVSNFGSLDAAPVRVDFWFIAPALGIVPSAPQNIGFAWTTVLAGHTKLVQCPTQWTAPTYETNLHACLIVTCSAPAQNDTPTAPTSPNIDRHVGQRNLTIIEAAPGQTLPLQFLIGNPFARGAETRLVGAANWQAKRGKTTSLRIGRLGVTAAIRAAEAARDPEATKLWLRRASLVDLAARTEGAQARTAHERPAQLFRMGEVRPLKATVARTVLAPPHALVPHVDFAALSGGAFLEPGQTAEAELEVTVPNDPKAPWLELHVAQAQNGLITGGYTVLVKVRERG